VKLIPRLILVLAAAASLEGLPDLARYFRLREM
jgi:hypothetical protein